MSIENEIASHIRDIERQEEALREKSLSKRQAILDEIMEDMEENQVILEPWDRPSGVIRLVDARAVLKKALTAQEGECDRGYVEGYMRGVDNERLTAQEEESDKETTRRVIEQFKDETGFSTLVMLERWLEEDSSS